MPTNTGVICFANTIPLSGTGSPDGKKQPGAGSFILYFENADLETFGPGPKPEPQKTEDLTREGEGLMHTWEDAVYSTSLCNLTHSPLSAILSRRC
jgi:hypothetical protein